MLEESKCDAVASVSTSVGCPASWKPVAAASRGNASSDLGQALASARTFRKDLLSCTSCSLIHPVAWSDIDFGCKPGPIMTSFADGEASTCLLPSVLRRGPGLSCSTAWFFASQHQRATRFVKPFACAGALDPAAAALMDLGGRVLCCHDSVGWSTWSESLRNILKTRIAYSALHRDVLSSGSVDVSP